MALELEEAGLISSCEDENDDFLLDPLHKQDYNDWKKGNIIKRDIESDEIDWDAVREECVNQSVSQVLIDIKFNPIKP